MRIALIQAMNPELEGLVYSRFNHVYNKAGRSPLGLAYIAAVLAEDGHECIIVDRGAEHCKSGFSLEKVDGITKAVLRDFQPDYVGISSFTVTFSDALHVASMVKSMEGFGDIPILMGGFHPTVEHVSVFEECPEVDLILKGEAEYSFRELLRGADLREVEGISFRDADSPDGVYSNPAPRNAWDLDQLPYPSRHLLDMDYYTQANSSAMVGVQCEAVTFISSRGCPHRCRFCGANRMSSRVRSHSAEYVIGEIEHVLDNHDCSCIVFADQMFLTDNKRVERFCELMIDKRLNKQVCWAANSRVDYVNKKILDYMYEAGCRWICYGFETGSQRMLELINKKVKRANNLLTAKITKESGILVSASMISGLPGEREEDFRQSVEFLEEVQPYSSGFNLFTLLPGTDYYYEFMEKGLLDPEDRDWRVLGNASVEKPTSYSEVPKDRLMELTRAANSACAKRSNDNYFKYNYLKEPQQARVRYNYTTAGKMPERSCLETFDKAIVELKKDSLGKAIYSLEKALEERPCVMPCPCTSGCAFHYDVKMLLSFAFLGTGQVERAVAPLQELLNIRRPDFDLSAARSLYGIIRGENEHATTLHSDTSRIRTLPLFTESDGSFIKKRLQRKFGLRAHEQMNSVVDKQRIIFDCHTETGECLGEVRLGRLSPSRYSFHYDVLAVQGGILVSIEDESGKLAKVAHAVSTPGILNFSVTSKREVTVRVYCLIANQPYGTNVELTLLGLKKGAHVPVREFYNYLQLLDVDHKCRALGCSEAVSREVAKVKDSMAVMGHLFATVRKSR